MKSDDPLWNLRSNSRTSQCELVKPQNHTQCFCYAIHRVFLLCYLHKFFLLLKKEVSDSETAVELGIFMVHWWKCLLYFVFRYILSLGLEKNLRLILWQESMILCGAGVWTMNMTLCTSYICLLHFNIQTMELFAAKTALIERSWRSIFNFEQVVVLAP